MPNGLRRLCLLRHAKSSWEDPTLADFDRPLAPRGQAAAPRIAAWMAENGFLPDVALCSAAARTRETWDLAAPRLGKDVPVRFLRSIYEAPWERLLGAVRDLPATARTAVLIGHNPGMEELAGRLAGGGSDRDALSRMSRKFPTAAVAVFDVAGSGWADLAPGMARLAAFVRPKDLGKDSGEDLAGGDQSQKRDSRE